MSENDIIFPENVEDLTEQEVVAMINTFLADSEKGQQAWRVRADAADKFYRGEQWIQEDLDILEEQGVPALTINLIKSQVQFMSGSQKKNKKDIRVAPVKAGSHTVAKILTSLIKHTMDKSHGEYEISEAFTNGLITGKGWVKLSLDKSYDSLNGDILIENVSPFRIYEDTIAQEYDLNKSAKFIIEVDWVDKQKIVLDYPDKKDDLEGMASATSSSRSVHHQNTKNSLMNFIYGSDLSGANDDGIILDRNKYRYMVVECWFKSYEKRWHLVNKENLTDKIITDKEDIKISKQQAEDNPELWAMVENTDKVLWKAKVVNNILLELTKDPFNINSDDDDGDKVLQPSLSLFPYVRYVMDYDNGFIKGMVSDLQGPQQEINKLHSQSLHIVNSSANGGWTHEEGSLTKEEEQNLQDNGASTGIIIKHRKGMPAPVKIKANPLPAAHEFMADLNNQLIDQISGINKANQGLTESGESGKLNQLRQIQGLTINTTAFDNLSYTMRIMGTALHDIIRSTNIYSEAEIKAILDELDLVDIKTMQQASNNVAEVMQVPTIDSIVNSTDPALVRKSLEQYKILQEEFNRLVREEAERLTFEDIKDITKGRYGIKITESDLTETVRMKRTNDAIAIEQLRPGQLPIDTLIKALNIDDGEEMIQSIKASQQAQQQLIQQQQAISQSQVPVPTIPPQ